MQIIAYHPPVEARAWLRANQVPSALATNRFPTTESALAFVEMLYAAGATEVLVDSPGVDADGDAYAHTLLVRLPASTLTRAAVRRLCEQEGPGDVPSGDFTLDEGPDEIRLWWG